MEITSQYFEKAGKANTDATLAASRQRADALGIHQIVVASTHGYTGLKARETFPEKSVPVTTPSVPACRARETPLSIK